jgi:hypothetical protein
MAPLRLPGVRREGGDASGVAIYTLAGPSMAPARLPGLRRVEGDASGVAIYTLAGPSMAPARLPGLRRVEGDASGVAGDWWAASISLPIHLYASSLAGSADAASWGDTGRRRRVVRS